MSIQPEKTNFATATHSDLRSDIADQAGAPQKLSRSSHTTTHQEEKPKKDSYSPEALALLKKGAEVVDFFMQARTKPPVFLVAQDLIQKNIVKLEKKTTEPQKASSHIESDGKENNEDKRSQLELNVIDSIPIATIPLGVTYLLVHFEKISEKINQNFDIQSKGDQSLEKARVGVLGGIYSFFKNKLKPTFEKVALSPEKRKIAREFVGKELEKIIKHPIDKKNQEAFAKLVDNIISLMGFRGHDASDPKQVAEYFYAYSKDLYNTLSYTEKEYLNTWIHLFHMQGKYFHYREPFFADRKQEQEQSLTELFDKLEELEKKWQREGMPIQIDVHQERQQFEKQFALRAEEASKIALGEKLDKSQINTASLATKSFSYRSIPQDVSTKNLKYIEKLFLEQVILRHIQNREEQEIIGTGKPHPMISSEDYRQDPHYQQAIQKILSTLNAYLNLDNNFDLEEAIQIAPQLEQTLRDILANHQGIVAAHSEYFQSHDFSDSHLDSLGLTYHERKILYRDWKNTLTEQDPNLADRIKSLGIDQTLEDPYFENYARLYTQYKSDKHYHCLIPFLDKHRDVKNQQSKTLLSKMYMAELRYTGQIGLRPEDHNSDQDTFYQVEEKSKEDPSLKSNAEKKISSFLESKRKNLDLIRRRANVAASKLKQLSSDLELDLDTLTQNAPEIYPILINIGRLGEDKEAAAKYILQSIVKKGNEQAFIKPNTEPISSQKKEEFLTWFKKTIIPFQGMHFEIKESFPEAAGEVSISPINDQDYAFGNRQLMFNPNAHHRSIDEMAIRYGYIEAGKRFASVAPSASDYDLELYNALCKITPVGNHELPFQYECRIPLFESEEAFEARLQWHASMRITQLRSIEETPFSESIGSDPAWKNVYKTILDRYEKGQSLVWGYQLPAEIFFEADIPSSKILNDFLSQRSQIDRETRQFEAYETKLTLRLQARMDYYFGKKSDQIAMSKIGEQEYAYASDRMLQIDRHIEALEFSMASGSHYKDLLDFAQFRNWRPRYLSIDNKEVDLFSLEQVVKNSDEETAARFYGGFNKEDNYLHHRKEILMMLSPVQENFGDGNEMNQFTIVRDSLYFDLDEGEFRYMSHPPTLKHSHYFASNPFEYARIGESTSVFHYIHGISEEARKIRINHHSLKPIVATTQLDLYRQEAMRQKWMEDVTANNPYHPGRIPKAGYGTMDDLRLKIHQAESEKSKIWWNKFKNKIVKPAAKSLLKLAK